MSSGSKRLKIFAHDAGSGNCTFALAKKYAKEGYTIEAFGLGPSAKIYEKEIREWVKPLPPQFHSDDLVVTGLSGMHSKFELEMVKAARVAGVKRTISIMDIPYNLDIRFQKNGAFLDESYFPEEIWIPELAEPSASEEIQKRLLVKPNPYWEYVKEAQYSSPPKITDDFIRKHQGKYVLYLTDYITEQYGDSLGYTEITVMKQFLKAHANLCSDVPLLLRLHPAEKRGGYEEILSAFPSLKWAMSQGPLNEALWYAALVCGSISSVFYESTLVNKPSFSLQIGAKEVRKRAPKGVSYIADEAELDKALRGWLTSSRS